jgi:predicted DsbA family dithiol-disulfide isomerase
LILNLATDAGADTGRVRRAIRDHAHKKDLDADAALAEDYEVADTPTFFINGRRLVGAQRLGWFERIIEEEIAKGEGLVARGLAPADVYDALTKGGRAPRRPANEDYPKRPVAYEDARDRQR